MLNRQKNRIMLLLVIAFVITTQLAVCEEAKTNYLYFPRAKNPWETRFLIGLSITKLPTPIVEEEINTAPKLSANFRMGLPLNFSLNLNMSSNYLSNMGTGGLQFHLINGDIAFSFGANMSVWFGHVDFESIKLKSWGYMAKPYVSAGLDLGEVLLTGSAELQWGKMLTYSEDKLLAEFNQPNSAYIIRLVAEQPLWKDRWFQLGIGLHYATFYYESWLSYSAIKEYLLYPEFYMGFIL